jgi:triosephosphate isomerase
MNPASYNEALKIFNSIKRFSTKLNKTSVIICPPFVYSQSFIKKNKDNLISIGAQNVFSEEQGSFTGEVSVNMLKDLGINYVIVGHSERRAKGETDEDVAKKSQLVLDSGMYAVVCIGEKERDVNGNYLNFIKEQIKNSLSKLNKKSINKLIIAYEPIWAIGAKEAMGAGDILEMTLFIKKVISDMFGQNEASNVPILYGGSVNFRNAGDIIIKGQVNGLLVGRESVSKSGFVELLKVVDLQ